MTSRQNYNRWRGDVPYFRWHAPIRAYKKIKIWAVIFYIINGSVTIKKLDNISQWAYFMGYASNKVFLIYKKTDHTCNGHRFHYAWFYEYIYFISTEDNNTLIYLLIQQYPESIINNLDMINLVPCELDLTPIPFWDSSMITYVIELPPDGKQNGFQFIRCQIL